MKLSKIQFLFEQKSGFFRLTASNGATLWITLEFDQNFSSKVVCMVRAPWLLTPYSCPDAQAIITANVNQWQRKKSPQKWVDLQVVVGQWQDTYGSHSDAEQHRLCSVDKNCDKVENGLSQLWRKKTECSEYYLRLVKYELKYVTQRHLKNLYVSLCLSHSLFL